MEQHGLLLVPRATTPKSESKKRRFLWHPMANSLGCKDLEWWLNRHDNRRCILNQIVEKRMWRSSSIRWITTFCRFLRANVVERLQTSSNLKWLYVGNLKRMKLIGIEFG